MSGGQSDLLLAGRYRLAEELGQGGMAVVYRAVDIATQNPVAIKLLKPEAVRKEGALERIRREGDLLRSLEHPGIVKVDTFGELEGGQVFVAMELLKGRNLRQQMRSCGPLPVSETLSWFRAVGAALSYAHARGIVHRDLKPENIFLAETAGGPQVKVLDFGISVISGLERLTSTGELLGTPAYMAPEQLKGEKSVDARTDLYALAVVLYEALAGMQPFHASTLTDLVVTILNGKATDLQVYRPDLPWELVSEIRTGMAPDRSNRPRSVEVFVQAVERASGFRALPPEQSEAARKAGQRTSAFGGYGDIPEGVGAPGAGTAFATRQVAPALPESAPAAVPSSKPPPRTRSDLPAHSVRSAPVAAARNKQRSLGSQEHVAQPVSAQEAPAPAPPKMPPQLSSGTSFSTAQLRLPTYSRTWWWVLAGVLVAATSATAVLLVLRWMLPVATPAAATPAVATSEETPVEPAGVSTRGPALAASPGGSAQDAAEAEKAPPETVEGRRTLTGQPSQTSRKGRSARTNRPRQRRSRPVRGQSVPSSMVRIPALPDPDGAGASSSAPVSPGSLLRQARGALRSGDTRTCLDYAQQALEAGGGSAALRIQGDCHLRAGHAQQALQSYQRFCRLGRDHPAIDEVRALVANLGGRCP